MKVKSLRPSRIPDRIICLFDDKQYLPLYADDVFKLKIAPGQDIIDDEFERLVNHSLTYLLTSYAYHQISISPKIPSTLIPKMRLKARVIGQKYKLLNVESSAIIQAIIEALQAKNLLSTQSFVDSTFHRLSRKPRSYILNYLRHHGIRLDQVTIPNDNQDSSLLTKLLHSKKYQNLKNADPKTKNRLISSLIRRGFAYSDIKNVIDLSDHD